MTPSEGRRIASKITPGRPLLHHQNTGSTTVAPFDKKVIANQNINLAPAEFAILARRPSVIGRGNDQCSLCNSARHTECALYPPHAQHGGAVPPLKIRRFTLTS